MTSWYESLIDRQIREAQERGEFDNLPGAGKPLPGHGEEYEEDWWIKELIRRENITGVLPASLRLRREVEDLMRTVATSSTNASCGRSGGTSTGRRSCCPPSTRGLARGALISTEAAGEREQLGVAAGQADQLRADR